MGAESPPVHVFMVSFPGQGHVNPLLRLANKLASKGIFVTFSAPEGTGKQMKEASNISLNEPTRVGEGCIRFDFFNENLSETDPIRKDLEKYVSHLEQVGKVVVPQMIGKYNKQGLPVSCFVNNPFIPWVSEIAESLGLPSAVLWVQSCACFASYYHYNEGIVKFPTEEDPYTDVQLPGMPLLKYDEVPSFLHPSTPYPFLATAILGQFKKLDKSFCVLLDTFDELESEVIDYMSKVCPIKTIGPVFKYPKATTDDNIVRGDLFKADDCIEWLDKKPPSSVVYVSFGSIVYLNQDQCDEIGYGLLHSGVSFLWVIRPPPKDRDVGPVSLPQGFLEKVGDKGKIVQWSPQEKVLSHESIACFLTHCGWNSTLEALASGVPVVAFPQWGDQGTDAKFLVDVFNVGVRLSRGDYEDRLVTRDEVEKCLIQATLGPSAAHLKRNALKWKNAAEAAIANGGSSQRNIQAFIDELKKRTHNNNNSITLEKNAD